MLMRVRQHVLDLYEEINVDGFAGGGGWSDGWFKATGGHMHVAFNHSAKALSMHAANHPQTRHIIADVSEVDPREVCGTRPCGHFHISPDCTHHSQAAGGQPRNERRRSLAWVGPRWTGTVRPRILTLENVKQILQWGPLVAKRDPETGRVITLDKVIGADGKKTNRIAEPGEVVPRDKQYLIPDKKRAGQTWKKFIQVLRSQGYEVDWKIIQSRDYGDATIRERLYMIARCDGVPVTFPAPTHFKNPKKGQKRWNPVYEHIDFTIPSQSIFDRKKPLAAATLRRIAKGMHKYVLNNADPFIIQVTQSSSSGVFDVRQPLNTITTAKGGEFAVVAPVLIQAGHGEGSGSTKRWGSGAKSVKEPLGTIVSSGGGHALSIAHLLELRHHQFGNDLQSQLSTIAAAGQHHGLVEYELADQESVDKALRVSAFLMSYYGTDNISSVTEPAPTITTKDRLALVTVVYEGNTYLIVDIKMRMLKPKELYSAQGFSKDYIFTHGHDGRIFTVADQVRMVGNSVSPNTAAALIRHIHGIDEMRMAA